MITFVYSYYKNAGMFKFQQENWNNYSDFAKKNVEIIVTDDCSPDAQSIDKNIIIPLYPQFRVFKIKEKVPWNWLECRNIGAKYAKFPWLLLTDMDHVVTPETVDVFLEKLKKFDPAIVYQFSRVKADGSPKRFHDDSFIVFKKLFWECGGYDEFFSGHYGTSGMFRRRLLSYANNRKLLNEAMVLYGREVIPDASTTDFARKGKGRNKNALKELRRKKTGKCVHFRFPYEEVNLDF